MSSRDDGLDVAPEPPRVGSAEAVDAGPVGPVGIAVAEPAKPRAGDTHDIGPTRAGGGLPPELDPRRPRRRRPRPEHAVRRIVLGVLLVALVIPGWSVGQALTASGTDSVAARLAEWARGHGGARVVTWAEQLQYRLHPPKTGGTPAGGIPGSTGTDPHLQASRPLHPVPAVVSPALPGEGQWRVLTAVRGHPAVQAAYLRPDATHTSYLAAVAELDPALVRVDLHPGTQEPGHGPWSLPPALPADKTGVVAAFNSGFRLGEAQGGYYSDERTVGTLRPGAASLVIKRDGTATVGQWGRDVRLGPQVVAVRQNLALLVDGGQVVPGIADNTGNRWGATLGNKLYVARSGLGVTATGQLVYVAGPSLSAATLADLLARAGSVRAMELDINPEWTSFSYYVPGPTGAPAAAKLLASMQRPANRYESTSTRDFLGVLAR